MQFVMFSRGTMQSANFVEKLYKEYYSDRDYEQVDLFRLLKEKYKIKEVIYPGCFVHISPSFVFRNVAYIDSDKNAKKFFNNEKLDVFINKRKEYPEDPNISFYGINYKKTIDDLRNQFDLLISQYAGFISDTCKEYLRFGGILIVNNSHGDAGLASLDKDYKLIATAHKTKGKYRISEASLEEYFIPKKDVNVTRELLYKSQKGVGYSKTAPLYLFQRISLPSRYKAVIRHRRECSNPRGCLLFWEYLYGCKILSAMVSVVINSFRLIINQ